MTKKAHTRSTARPPMTKNVTRPRVGARDPDGSKGAVEGDRPTDTQRGNPLGSGVDEQGMPSDPVATAQDRVGANIDRTEG